MMEEGIQIEELPGLTKPFLIAGFDGWGNALNVSQGMVDYMIRKLTKAKYFAKINPDIFYRYDETRPLVSIEQGELKSLSMPGGSFYSARIDLGERDLVILKANEPHLRWFYFVDELLSHHPIFDSTHHTSSIFFFYDRFLVLFVLYRIRSISQIDSFYQPQLKNEEGSSHLILENQCLDNQ